MKSPRTFQYDLKTVEQPVGDQLFRIECIRDLNATIDQLFSDFEDTADTSLLEDLCPYFGVIWPSARALCEVLAGRRHELKGASVLEVGCGLALPSLLCAKNGAHVTAADFHPEVPGFLTRNRELNGVSDSPNDPEGSLQFALLDWRTADSSGVYDWVIGSDILYERQHPGPVARALASRCAPQGKIFLADPARPYLQEFSDEMRRLGFREETRVLNVPTEGAEGAPASVDVFVLEFTR